MRTFYIFKLNSVYEKISTENPANIYLLFKSIYTYDKSNIDIAFDLFNDIVLPINSNFINEYIYNKLKNSDGYIKYRNIHMYNNYFTNEVSKMSVLNSYIKIKSNLYNNIFINNLEEITSMFVCDFLSDKYSYFSYKNSVKKK